MTKRLALLLAALSVGLVALVSHAQTPAMPTYQVPFSERIKPSASQDTALIGNGTGCTVPGGASCTVVTTNPIPVYGWNCFTLYFQNTHASATVDDVLVEVSPLGSPDGGQWAEILKDQFDALTAGTMKVVVFCPNHYAYIRIEARAASTSSMSVWTSAYRN